MSLSTETLARRVRDKVTASGRRDAEVAAAIDMDPTALSKALSGRRQFKPLELARLADELGASIDLLLADEDEALEPVLVAARAQHDGPAIDEASKVVEHLVQLNRLLTDVGCDNQPAINFPVRGVAVFEQGKALARQVRTSVDRDWLPEEFDELAELVETSLRVDVAVAELPSGLDGLSVVQGDFRLALINSNLPPTRQRFTLGHELGHIFAGDTENVLIDESVVGSSTPREIRANAFAAEFLVPGEQLREELWGQTEDESKIEKLLSRYRVSLDVLAFHAHNCDIVDAVGRDRMRRMSSARFITRAGRMSDLQTINGRRVPGRLLFRAVHAYVAGRISIRPIAGLLDTEPDLLLTQLAPILSGEESSDVMVP
ncbi:helix-turn-helix domain-containing protein [Nocardia jejuensis]|uniref:helix-turn-helix domain-containing protein n=1 Tax=Nocardia jejuensis TaxID=328049 RepID=UPI0008311ADB|nr:XRE family transcriptional regulator [Nocardia jejuensis]